MSKASSQKIASKPSCSRRPTRFSGWVSRPGPCTNSGQERATLLQITAAVYGLAFEPRTPRMRPPPVVPKGCTYRGNPVDGRSGASGRNRRCSQIGPLDGHVANRFGAARIGSRRTYRPSTTRRAGARPEGNGSTRAPESGCGNLVSESVCTSTWRAGLHLGDAGIPEPVLEEAVRRLACIIRGK